MIVYVAAASAERVPRGEWALECVREAPDLVLAHDWAAQIREYGTANHGIGGIEQARLAELALEHVTRAGTLWLLVPEEPTFGAGVELGAFALAVRARVRAPRRIVASGGRRDVSIFVGLADVYFEHDADALQWLYENARAERERIAKIAPPA